MDAVMMKAVRDSLQMALRVTASMALLEPDLLDEFVAACDTADTVGPFADPTLWIANHEALAAMRDDARDMARLVRAVRKRHPELAAVLT